MACGNGFVSLSMTRIICAGMTMPELTAARRKST